MTDTFIIGLVGPPFGIDGFVKVRPFSGDIENLLKLKEVRLRSRGTEKTLAIEESRAAPPAALLRFAGIGTPEAAKTLGGMEIIAGREQASPLADGEFYIEDLKGLAVVARDSGETLGRITGIVEGGGGELAEIKLESGALRLVPFRKEFFIDISPKKGKAILDNRWILE